MGIWSPIWHLTWPQMGIWPPIRHLTWPHVGIWPPIWPLTCQNQAFDTIWYRHLTSNGKAWYVATVGNTDSNKKHSVRSVNWISGANCLKMSELFNKCEMYNSIAMMVIFQVSEFLVGLRWWLGFWWVLICDVRAAWTRWANRASPSTRSKIDSTFLYPFVRNWARFDLFFIN